MVRINRAIPLFYEYVASKPVLAKLPVKALSDSYSSSGFTVTLGRNRLPSINRAPMSHADIHRDSSSANGRDSSGPIPRQVTPPVTPPRTTTVPPPPADPPPPQVAEANSPLPPVPPPPPPRSTLPPVRSALRPQVASGLVASGLGTAKGVRWRGELSDVQTPASKQTSRPDDGGSEGTDDSREQDRVTREVPSWLVSMVMHLILLLVLALVSTPAGTNLGSVMLSIGQSERESPVELTEFSIEAVDSMSVNETLEDSQADIDLTSVFEAAELTDVTELIPVELGAGAEVLVVKPMFNGRTGAMKQALLAIYGGTTETQDAVARGLAWLKRNQKKDGSWSMRGPYSDGGFSENQTAATAMALLAFLGDGNTHQSGEYAEQVEKGMKFLLSKQDRSGFFARGTRAHEKMYAQAQATIAICELYGMTKDSWLRPRAQLALDFAMKSQSPEGGWRYEPKFDSDTSVTGWFVMALESGRAGGLEVNISVLLKVNSYLDTAASFDDAAYGYQARGTPSPAMTAEGLLCRQYISWTREHLPLIRGIEALLTDAPFDMSDRDVYYWYYATQVLHHYGGSPWRRWNEVMRVELPKAQVKKGREDGSWAPQMDRWGRNSGRLYTTCMSLYCLEVYYRHMPLYHADGKQLD